MLPLRDFIKLPPTAFADWNRPFSSDYSKDYYDAVDVREPSETSSQRSSVVFRYRYLSPSTGVGAFPTADQEPEPGGIFDRPYQVSTHSVSVRTLYNFDYFVANSWELVMSIDVSFWQLFTEDPSLAELLSWHEFMIITLAMCYLEYKEYLRTKYAAPFHCDAIDDHIREIINQPLYLPRGTPYALTRCTVDLYMINDGRSNDNVHCDLINSICHALNEELVFESHSELKFEDLMIPTIHATRRGSILSYGIARGPARVNGVTQTLTRVSLQAYASWLLSAVRSRGEMPTCVSFNGSLLEENVSKAQQASEDDLRALINDLS